MLRGQGETPPAHQLLTTPKVGIPFDLSQRLTGENEDAIRKDAQSLAKLLKPQTPKSPPRSTEPAGGSSRRDALRAFTNNLMSKGE